MRFQLSSLQHLADAAANLNAQLCELNELRERVRKAELAPPKSPQPNRWNAGIISRLSPNMHGEAAAPGQIDCRVIMPYPLLRVPVAASELDQTSTSFAVSFDLCQVAFNLSQQFAQQTDACAMNIAKKWPPRFLVALHEL